MRQFYFAIAAFLLSTESWAISKLNDYQAGAVLRDGKPCFYTNRPIEAIAPRHLQGQGAEAEVYARNRHDNESLKGNLMKHQGRGIIRIGDGTDHGGKVVSVSSGTVVMGREAALANDLTICPKCKGSFPIQPAGVGAHHEGRAYAYDGDVTACGARLIATM